VTAVDTMEQRSQTGNEIGERLGKPSHRGVDVHGHSTVWAGAAWMIGLSLLLFFVPAVNGLIAGAVGGYLVGSWSRALTAAVLPAIVVAIALWFGFGLMGLPVIGFLTGTAISLWIIFSELGLFLGAALGGTLHQVIRHA
jgi:hypothetical protein